MVQRKQDRPDPPNERLRDEIAPFKLNTPWTAGRRNLHKPADLI